METLKDFRLSDFQELLCSDSSSLIMMTLNSKLSIEQAHLIKKYSSWKKI